MLKAPGSVERSGRVLSFMNPTVPVTTIPSLSYPAPVHRRLKVFAFDPMLGRSPLHRITLNVPYEPLTPGPKGSRIQVIDFDGVCQTYYEPVNLDEDLLLLQDGLDPTESDPRFHQRMVYGVAMKVVENFDAALGRRFYFRGRKPLRLFPHAPPEQAIWSWLSTP